eukprot:TRINITY_DN82428_c0_g1_i1.p1 TRINITY_DN82428_c0_g1~~TRINITY_DN82428_c0_g1_i1.p1  ORF type:complete len:345 (+),score=68.42 TRINITY_DN82428_c0_g1_i1:158-1192(+)
MEYGPDGNQDMLIDSAQEKTARRTQHFLVAARLAFAFSHGALIISASIALGWEVGSSWWTIFTPAWLGDTVCMALIIASWFGSCPYVQACLQERQARLGDANPSILTEILPDIMMGIFGLLFMILALVAEILLCRYLDGLRSGQGVALSPCAVVAMLVSLLTCCRGVCISTSGELFSCVGFGALGTCIAALAVPGGPLGKDAWVLVLPWVLAVLGFQLGTAQRIRRCSEVFCREELFLRIAEQIVLLMVFFSLLGTVLLLSPVVGQGPQQKCRAGVAGVVAGVGICLVAGLRTRMAVTESRRGSISERLMVFNIRRSQQANSQSSAMSAVGREVLLASSLTSIV